MIDLTYKPQDYKLTMHELLAVDLGAYVGMLATGQWAGPGPLGCPVGVWQSLVGQLNRVFVLQRVQNGDSDALGRPDAAADSSCPVQPVERTVQFLRSVKPVIMPAENAKLFELRLYTLLPGALSVYIPLLLDALPAREKYSKNVGIWAPITGSVDTLVHVWAYEDANQRAELRPLIDADPVWHEFVPKILPLIRSIQTYFMSAVSVPRLLHSSSTVS